MPDIATPSNGPKQGDQVADTTNQAEKAAISTSEQDKGLPNDQPKPDSEVPGGLTPNEGATSEHQAADAPKEPEAPSLRAAYAVMRALHGDRVPDGALDADTVPAGVLDLPIAIAIEDLVQHAKRCQNLNCPHVPSPLRAYRRMRPDAIRNAREQVYKVLWTHPNHELVVQVRKQILKNHSGLVDEISTGRLLTGENLTKTLNELGASGPVVLAAVLWALEFKGPIAEMLFRILVPLAAGEKLQSSEAEEDDAGDDLRRRSLKAKREWARDSARFKRAAEQATKDLQSKAQALE